MKIKIFLFFGLILSYIIYPNNVTISGNAQNDKLENCDQIVYSNNLSVSKYENSEGMDAYYSGTFYLANSLVGKYIPDLSKTISFNAHDKIVLGPGFKAVPTNTGKLVLSVNDLRLSNSNEKTIDANINDIYSLDINKNNNYHISQNYPNGVRMNEIATIDFYIPEKSLVEITIYSILGGKVITLESDIFTEGKYSIQFSPSQYQMTPGYYTYTFNVNGGKGTYSQTMKMLVIE
ncbi:hypothetical protein ACFLTE_07505 [Bacteroidota bacterium]